MQIETTIEILNSYGFGRDKIAKLLNVSRKLVDQVAKQKYEFNVKKQRLHRELNPHLEAELFVDDTKITVNSLFDSNRHSRVILNRYSVLTLADRKGVLAIKVVASVQITKDDLLKFLRENLDKIKGKRIQFDRFNRDLEQLGRLLGFTPIVKVKSRAKPYMAEVERIHALWKKRLYNVKHIVKELAKQDETLCLQLVEALIQAELFNNPQPLLAIHQKLEQLKPQQIKFKAKEKAKARLGVSTPPVLYSLFGLVWMCG